MRAKTKARWTRNPTLFFSALSLLSLFSLVQASSQCTSIDSFCDEFADICIKSCAAIHHPRGFSQRTELLHKCDHRGPGYYYGRSFLTTICFRLTSSTFVTDLMCNCDGKDITTSVLDQVASSPANPSTQTKTATKTDTRTVTTTIHSVKDTTVRRTATKTSTITPHTTVTRRVNGHDTTTTITATGTTTRTITTTVLSIQVKAGRPTIEDETTTTTRTVDRTVPVFTTVTESSMSTKVQGSILTVSTVSSAFRTITTTRATVVIPTTASTETLTSTITVVAGTVTNTVGISNLDRITVA
jgi:hypothetical protein